MSDVLQLDCSMHNEIARNATKNFAGTLGKAFEQYKKLWNEYLKLREHCEDANFKIPFQLFESDDYNDKDISSKDINTSSQVCGFSLKSPDTSQVIPENTKTCASVGASSPIVRSSGAVGDLDDNILCNDKFGYEQTNPDRLQSSPILIKDRARAKKTIALGYSSQSSSSKDSDEYASIKENLSILSNSPKKNELFIEPKEDERSLFSFAENNDEIACTPVAKMAKKLGVSKLYNVDTTLLKNGKKIKQSKLVFLSSDQSSENRLYPSRSHVPSTPEKKMKRSKDNQSTDEEIIQVSPVKSTESNLRIKSLKVKRKTPVKVNQADTKEKNIYDSREVKFPLKEKGQITLKQKLSSMCTSKQEDQLSPLKKSKTFNFSNDEKTRNKHDISTALSLDDNFEHTRCTDIENLLASIKKDKESEIIKDINQTKKESYSESINQKAYSNFSTCDDETFCMLGEKLKEVPGCDSGESQIIKRNIFKDDKSSVPSPVRRSLMNSFDMPCKRKNTEIDQPSKKRSDRAKMSGVACWECKEYYANLGLSEKEINARQNQCSRHRTNQKKRQDTPEGFWNPLFSGTFSSTFQDN